MKIKFSVEEVATAGVRLGKIESSSSANSSNHATMETPMCTLFTKGGSVPHLSAAMASRIKTLPGVASINLGQMACHHESIQEFGKGLGEFTGQKDKIIFTTLQDASVPLVSGKNDKNSVAVWNKGGKMKLDADLYIRVQEAMKPDWMQALSDSDTDRECARKRLIKAVDRTLDFLDKTVEAKAKSKILSEVSLIGSVQGGWNLEERKRSARETASRPVDGFLIEGFEKGNSGVDLWKEKDFAEILNATLSELPSTKPRVVESVWSPLQTLQGAKAGIDVFSSAYAHIQTELGRALQGPWLPPSSSPPDAPTPKPCPLTINLHDSKFRADFSPLAEECDSYASQNFTRAYLHHLLNTGELLASVLLSIHNFHQYFDFFHCLRLAAKNGKLDEMESWLEAKERLEAKEAMKDNKDAEKEDQKPEEEIAQR